MSIPTVAANTLLGRSGLRVSRFCLGTMTFGTEWGWGVDEASSRALLDRYVEAGGNFIDTADIYTNGSSERIVGAWMTERANRDRMVVATKFTFNADKGNANAGGNGRKNLHRALEGSLRRLGTDYVDLYWVHAWDGLTPIEETMRSLDDVVRSGKARYVGFSDVPAWIAARGQTLAQLHAWEPLIALQLEYSLLERNIEREHVPMAQELGLGITPWGPLGIGMLTGKHKQGALPEGEGRAKVFENNPGFAKLFTERSWRIVDVVKGVAHEIGKSPAQVALNWATTQPGVSSTIIGATKVGQIDDNLQALAFDIPSALLARLDEVSRPELLHPYNIFEPAVRTRMSGGVEVVKRT